MASKKRPDRLSTTFFMEFHKKADVQPKKEPKNKDGNRKRKKKKHRKKYI